ncbi:MAG: hypothetical protein ACOZAO_05935 [Patescibacteria group bacterium]
MRKQKTWKPTKWDWPTFQEQWIRFLLAFGVVALIIPIGNKEFILKSLSTPTVTKLLLAIVAGVLIYLLRSPLYTKDFITGVIQKWDKNPDYTPKKKPFARYVLKCPEEELTHRYLIFFLIMTICQTNPAEHWQRLAIMYLAVVVGMYLQRTNVKVKLFAELAVEVPVIIGINAVLANTGVLTNSFYVWGMATTVTSVNCALDHIIAVESSWQKYSRNERIKTVLGHFAGGMRYSIIMWLFGYQVIYPIVTHLAHNFTSEGIKRTVFNTEDW